MAVKHAFTSAKADGADTTLVRPSNWNADHTVDYATTTEVADVAAAEAAGTSALIARGDHVHAHGSGYLPDAHHARSHDHSTAGDGTSLSPATLILPGATTPAQTAEGSVVWDTDNDQLTIGDGTSRKTLLDTGHEAAADPHPGYRLESADHTHASSGLQGGQVSHADLTNLTTGDPHTQYVQEAWLLSGRKTADQSWTSNAVLADVTGMTFSIGANEVWQFDFYIFANGATTGDLKLAITTPTGATIIAGALGGMAQGTTSLVNADQHGILTASGGFPNPYGMAGTAQANMIHVHGIVVNGANAGSITLQAAQQTSDATATTIMANSHYLAIRMA